MFNRQGGDYSSCYANLKKHLGNKSASDLIEELNKTLDDDQAAGRLPNPHLVAAYMDLVHELDPQSISSPPEQSAVERFFARHPETPPKEVPVTSIDSSPTLPKNVRRLRKQYVAVAAVVAALLFGLMITAYGERLANGKVGIGDDVISVEPRLPAVMVLEEPSENGFYLLAEALESYGIYGVAPKWLPDNSIIQGVDVSDTQNLLMIVGTYLNGDEIITISVNQYKTDLPNQDYQKTEKSENIYRSGGNTFYLMFNYELTKAMWEYGKSYCTISGNFSEQEIKKIIDSISER